MKSINRDSYLNALAKRRHNGLIKVITGLRRCGKTYLLFTLFADYLRTEGIAEDRIVEVSLDDIAFAHLRNPVALNDYLAKRLENRREMTYLFLDEIQYAIPDDEFRHPSRPPAIYDVLNGLLRRKNVDIYVTGSNSRLLSTDVLTQFRGRGDEVRVHPFSFAEFMQGFDGDRVSGWAEYTVFGGMPLTLSMADDEQKAQYLTNLFTETYLRDIIARNGVRNTTELADLIDVLASDIGGLTSVPKIQATFKSAFHSRISVNTIASYLDYLEEAFLIEAASRYDIKGRRLIGSPKKYYFEDVGLRNARLNFRQVEENHLMENIVYNELRARGYGVDVGVVERRERVGGVERRASLEVDFVANKGDQRMYIQSAWMVPTPEKMRQEKASLCAVSDNFKKVVLVRDVVKPLRDDRGILTMSVLDFLLDPDSLSKF